MKMTKDEYVAKRAALEKEFDLKFRDWIDAGQPENLRVNWSEKEQKDNDLWLEYLDGIEVGDHAHIRFYTDVEPCTVIKRTPKSITVRYDDGKLNPNWKPDMIVGGFAAHCTNNEEQQWDLFEDPNGRVETFRRRKTGWFNKGDCSLAPGWSKFYDYNF